MRARATGLASTAIAQAWVVRACAPALHRVFCRRLIAIGVIVIAVSIGAAGQEPSLEQRLESVAGLKATDVRRFLSELQTNVRNRDARAVCATIAFPLKVAQRSVRSPTQCRVQYSAIFTNKVVDAIAGQRFETLFVNAKGVMIGNGDVWLSGICHDTACRNQSLKIVAVNH